MSIANEASLDPAEVVNLARRDGAAVRVAFGHAIEVRQVSKVPQHWTVSITALLRAGAVDRRRHDIDTDWPRITGHNANLAYIVAGMILAEIGAPISVLTRPYERLGDVSVSWRVEL